MQVKVEASIEFQPSGLDTVDNSADASCSVVVLFPCLI